MHPGMLFFQFFVKLVKGPFCIAWRKHRLQRDGRNAARREEYRGILTRYPQKALRFTNPRALEHWKKEWMKQRTGDAAARRPQEEP